MQPSGKHSVALWAGLTALFTNLAAVGVINFFASPDTKNTAIAALITSGIVGLSVYAKQRLEDAKEARRADDERERQATRR